MRPEDKRFLKFIFALQTIVTTSFDGGYGCDDVNAEPWKPSWSVRDDLYCYNHCSETGAENYERCCACNSCTTWEGKEQNLYLEDLSVTGRNMVLSNNQSVDSNVYKIHRSYSEMKEFPVNLCEDINNTNLDDIIISISNISEYRSRIVVISFEYSEIEEIGDISCLLKLDELNLRYNRISFLSNTSFENLSNLRTLRLEGNRLTRLDPNTLSSKNLHILHADLSENQLSTVDVSNIVLSFQFCNVSFQSNGISEVLNENNFILNTSHTYGPGFLNLQGNSVKNFPDLETLLNINDLSVLGKVWSFGFDLRGIPIACDCSLHPFLSLSKDIIEALWQDYFEVNCTAPEHLKGIFIPDLNLTELVCPLDAESGCQSPQCTCVDEPDKDTLFIDCSNAIPSLHHFPTIPHSSYSTHISLNLSGNTIKYIPDEPYLSKLSLLDLSHNDIREINDSIAGRLEDTFLDLRNNDRLLRLPQTFQYRNACSVIIDDLIIDCDCDSQWIAEWLKTKACKNSPFFCNVPGIGKVPANSFNVDDLDCFRPSILIIVISVVVGGIIILLLASCIILHIFRYEVLIMYLRTRRNRSGKTHPQFMYDVYITLDEDNENIVPWVNNHLYDFLKNQRYKVFLPFRDIPYGGVRVDEAANAIERSRTLLVILSNNHFHITDDEHPLTYYEWKNGWNHFRKDRCKNIVLVNFDHIPAGDMKHPQVRAFMRVGSCIDFVNRDRNIMDQIQKELGEPQARPREPQEQPRLSEPQTRLSDSRIRLRESKIRLPESQVRMREPQLRLSRSQVQPYEPKVRTHGPQVNLFQKENTSKKIKTGFDKKDSRASLSVVELEFHA